MRFTPTLADYTAYIKVQQTEFDEILLTESVCKKILMHDN